MSSAQAARKSNPYLGPCDCDKEAAAGRDPGFCGDKRYVSGEEQIILAQMRRIRRDAEPVRQWLKDLGPGVMRTRLLARLELLRERFAHEREALRAASHRKMKRLGHV